MKMKIMTHRRYGRPGGVLEKEEVFKPMPKDDEILVKVIATSVTARDCRHREGHNRLLTGLLRPNKKVLGTEFSGIVEEVGKDVVKYDLGDEVYGLSDTCMGTYSEYICLPQTKTIEMKPSKLNHFEAATIPYGGAINALNFLKHVAQIKFGQRIIINGAAGTIGSYAIQLSKYYGAHVTAVCRTEQFNRVKALGADELVDYTKVDFSKLEQIYDIVFDVAGTSNYFKCKKLLRTHGTYMTTRASFINRTASILSSTVAPPLLGYTKSIVGDGTDRQDYVKKMDLKIISRIVEKDILKAMVDYTYQFEDLPRAHRYVENGLKKGNVAVRVS